MNGYLYEWVNFIYLCIYFKFNNAFLGAIVLNIHDFSYDQNNCDYKFYSSPRAALDIVYSEVLV